MPNKYEGVMTLANLIKKRTKLNKDCVVAITGNEGCLSGDTLINCNRASLGRKYSIKYMHMQYHQKEYNKGKAWNLDIPTFVRSFDGKSIRLHKINDVVYSGNKKVWCLELEDGKKIKATEDHKIMTDRGWVELCKLSVYDKIMCDTLKPQKGQQLSYKLKDIALKVKYHPYKNVRNEVEVHRLIYESYINNIKFIDYLDILWNDKEESNKMKLIDPSKYHIHHIDGNHYNNDVNNLELKNISEHLIEHAICGESFKHFNQGVPIFSKVKSISYAGIEDTYDIKCDEPHHNFVANGIVVHNCGKSTLAIFLAIFMDDKFTFLRNVIFMPNEKEIGEKVYALPKYSPLLIDEGMKALYKRNWQTKDRKNLNTLFSVCRKRNLAFFICIPNLWDLDNYFKGHRVQVWINVPKTGYAQVFMKSKSQWTDDPWNKVKNQKLIEKFTGGNETDTEAIIMANRKLSNHMFDFTFPDLDDVNKKTYLYLNQLYTDKESEDKVDEESERVKKLKKQIMYLVGSLKYEFKQGIVEISNKSGIGSSMINDLLKEYRKIKNIKTLHELKSEQIKETASRILSMKDDD